MVTEQSNSQYHLASEPLPPLSATTPQPDLSIIIPTRNETSNIAPLFSRIQRVLKGVVFELIFVDDSTDDTAHVIRETARQFAFETTVIARPPERHNGLGMAVVEGIRAARSEWIIVMDGDLQHPPEVIPELLDRANSTAADLVVASRLTEGGSTAGLSWRRSVLSRILALAMRACFPKNLRNVSDPLTGFFLLRRNRVAPDQLRPEGFKILLEILIRNPHLQVAEVPFEFGRRHSGKSKANSEEMLRLFRQTVKLRLLTMQRLLQFLAVGFSGLFVNSALLFAFTELLGMHYLVSATFATQGSTLWNFGWTEWWVFRDRAQQPLKFWQRLVSFLAMNNAMLLLRGPILALLVSWLGVNYLVANLLSLLVLTMMRYAIAANLIWGIGQERKVYYNIHNIIRIRSAQHLPELGYFRTDELLEQPDYDIVIDRNPGAHQTPDSIVYDEVPGRFGFSMVVNRTESLVEVFVSPLVGKSPHVLYTNVIEPLLRWSFARKGYALMHGACIAFDGQALFITAQTDTGKTTTILQTIHDHADKCDFLSDDMTIFTKEGQVMSYPKPLTISKHTLRAANCSTLTLKERIFLQVQSRLHSREGRHIGMWLSQGKIPAATLNAIVQAIIPPPKYMVNRLIPGSRITQRAQLAHIAVIERGPEYERGIGEQEKLRILVANAEDAYGFPPYPMLAHELSSWEGEDLHHVEREIVEAAIRELPAVHLRSSHFNWHQRLPGLVGGVHWEGQNLLPTQMNPTYIAKDTPPN